MGQILPRSMAAMMSQMERDFFRDDFFRDNLFREDFFRERSTPRERLFPDARARARQSVKPSTDANAQDQTKEQTTAPATTNGRETALKSFYDSMFDSDFAPTMDVIDNKDNYELKFNIPGVKKEDVKVSITGEGKSRVLTVTGQRHNEVKEDKKGVHRFESSFGSFSRSVYIPENVAPEDIKAKYEDGVLKLTIPKVEVTQEEPQAKDISIE